MSLKWVFALFWVLISVAGQVESQDSLPPQVSMTPNTLALSLCQQECATETLTLTFPPLTASTPEQLDVVFLFDISGSMDDTIDNVRDNAVNIADELRALVPETRFGIGVFSDYDDVPWANLQGLTPDLTEWQRSLEKIGLEGGGDTPESYTRALWEMLTYDWRTDSLKIIVLFTDAPPHEEDRGRDGLFGTADDLTFNVVLDQLKEADLRIIGIDSGSADEPLVRATERTNGQYQKLADVTTTASKVIELVTGVVLESRLAFASTEARFQGLLTQTPSTFSYPEAGGTLPVTLTFCPHEIALEKGNYNLNLQLGKTGRTYASLPVSLDYAPYCVLLNVPDVPSDDGLSCSEERFWRSDAIVIRHSADNIYQSQLPRVGQPNAVYVQVYNYGARQAEVTLTLKASQEIFAPHDSDSWQVVGTQTLTLNAESTLWSPSFEWIPQTIGMALRAEVTTPQDPITQSDSFRCEGNIAQRNELPIVLDVQSARAGYHAGVGTFFVPEQTVSNPVVLDDGTFEYLPREGTIERFTLTVRDETPLWLTYSENEEAVSGVVILPEIPRLPAVTPYQAGESLELLSPILPFVLSGVILGVIALILIGRSWNRQS